MGKSRTKKKIKEAAMSQSANSSINFDLSNINMWGAVKIGELYTR